MDEFNELLVFVKDVAGSIITRWIFTNSLTPEDQEDLTYCMAFEVIISKLTSQQEILDSCSDVMYELGIL
jgi:hypothetical protein